MRRYLFSDSFLTTAGIVLLEPSETARYLIMVSASSAVRGAPLQIISLTVRRHRSAVFRCEAVFAKLWHCTQPLRMIVLASPSGRDVSPSGQEPLSCFSWPTVAGRLTATPANRRSKSNPV